MAIDSIPSLPCKISGHVAQAAMMKEIFNRGPISCGIDAGPLLKYTSGIARWGNVIDNCADKVIIYPHSYILYAHIVYLFV